MSPRPGRKEESRAKILASAGRGFRGHGYGGLGVDGLAKAAGVTSGAFYAHFKSKAEAFREAVTAGMRDLTAGITDFQDRLGAGWRAGLVDFYVTKRVTCDIGESCALQNLTGEVARAGDDAREAYETELRVVIDTAASGLHGTDAARRGEAIALLALLSGGVSMARAVKDPALSEDIAAAVRAAAAKLETPA